MEMLMMWIIYGYADVSKLSAEVLQEMGVANKLESPLLITGGEHKKSKRGLKDCPAESTDTRKEIHDEIFVHVFNCRTNFATILKPTDAKASMQIPEKLKESIEYRYKFEELQEKHEHCLKRIYQLSECNKIEIEKNKELLKKKRRLSRDKENAKRKAKQLFKEKKTLLHINKTQEKKNRQMKMEKKNQLKTNETLSRKNCDLKKKVEDIERSLSYHKEQVTALEEQIKQEEEGHRKTSVQRDRLEEKNAIIQHKIQDCECELHREKKENIKRQERYERVIKENERTSREYRSLLLGQQQEIDYGTRKCNGMFNQIQDLVSIRKDKEASERRHRRRAELRNTQLADKCRMIAQLTEELRIYGSESQSSQEQASRLRRHVVTLRQERLVGSETIAQLQNDLHDHEEENERLHAENAELRHHINLLETQYESPNETGLDEEIESSGRESGLGPMAL